MNIAFFISSTGDLIQVAETHIATIISDPARFGLTPAEIETAYRKHGERIGVEGEARRELILRVISQGWIRIRRYRNYWSVTVDTLTPAVQELLHDWAGAMLISTKWIREADRYTPVRISTSERETVCEIGALAGGPCGER